MFFMDNRVLTEEINNLIQNLARFVNAILSLVKCPAHCAVKWNEYQNIRIELCLFLVNLLD